MINNLSTVDCSWKFLNHWRLYLFNVTLQLLRGVRNTPVPTHHYIVCKHDDRRKKQVEGTLPHGTACTGKRASFQALALSNHFFLQPPLENGSAVECKNISLFPWHISITTQITVRATIAKSFNMSQIGRRIPMLEPPSRFFETESTIAVE